jgi:hypothetical protein
MATQLQAVRTPTTATQLAGVIMSLWPTTVGGPVPDNTTLAILVAQSALETGSWQNCWNWNISNIAGMGGDYVMLHAYTGAYRPYRAFPTLNDGVTAYLQLLHSRYSAALNSAINDDLEGFVTNLKAKGYFEEDANAYYDAILPRYNSISKQLGGPITPEPGPLPLPPQPLPSRPAPSPWSNAATALVGGLALGGAAFLVHREVVAMRRPVRRSVRRRRAA